MEIGLTAGVTGRHGTITHPRYLMFPNVRACKPDFHGGLVHYPDLDALILATDCSVYLILNHWFWLLFLHLKWCARRSWPVNKGCLFLLGTWSYIWYIQMSVLFAHFLICTSYRTHEIDDCSLFLPYFLSYDAEVCQILFLYLVMEFHFG
jgi:hypothetical protein